MKKNNKKGFTIVELVIVIAVIAILSAVLIPTFTSISKKAKESAALQEATAAKQILLGIEDGTLDTAYDYYIINGEYTFKIAYGKLEAATAPATAGVDAADKVINGTYGGATVVTIATEEANDLGDVIVLKIAK